ncbi:Phytanoyl-CoA dioxygenase domain containing 1 [Minicystis rosea]|nr:Phytanoyl-CoA dioxygenase domain containing 1 [Minicystis rosea]
MANAPPSPPRITEEQRTRYDRDGFLVLEGFASPEACDALMARARELVAAFDPPDVASIFVSGDAQSRTTDAYFLGSGDTVRFFFEAGAFDERGQLRQDKALSINKIGHALHDLDATFASFSRTPALAAVARDVGMRAPRLMQSMYIFKQPHIGGEVVCHQDATYLYTDPISVVGFWFALEDATIENGAMWALPGGHRAGLKARFRRAGNDRVRTDVIDDSAWPAFAKENGYVPLEAKKGTLVVLHGLLPHLSGANTSDRSRHAYALHAIEASAHYPEDNWLQRDASMPARGF